MDRILRDYSTSAKFDGFPQSPETFFTRLLTKVDDYGRIDGDPANLRGVCFMRFPNIQMQTVDAWLKELSGHHIVLRYAVKGKPYLAIINFRQRKRTPPSKPKFPPPEGKGLYFLPDDGDWKADHEELLQPAATGGESRPYSYAKAETDAGDVGERNKSLSSKLSLGGLGGVVAHILSNRDGWSYDNCKVLREEFTPAQLTSVLRPSVGLITGAQVISAWNAAVLKAHKDAVDGMIKRNPAASCIDEFKRLLIAAATKTEVAEADDGQAE